MGWSSGSRVFEEIAEQIDNLNLSSAQKKEIFSIMINAFESADCDTLSECFGICDELDDELRDRDYEDWNDENEDE